MKLLRALLFPLMPFYFIATWIRNLLYDKGILASKTYSFPVICVGNLSTGGTGKTPMVEYLIGLLNSTYHVAVLSRGYKRQSKGFVLATASSRITDIGDEPFQFHSKFKKIVVAVDEKRTRGIEQLMQLEPSPEVIILDDAFQHRKVSTGLTILLTPFQKPFFKNVVLPTGDLREPRSGYRRADLIVITKCPAGLGTEDKELMRSQLQLQKHQQLFFSSIVYSNEVTNGKDKKGLDTLTEFTLVTGIANPQPLVDHLKALGKTFDHLQFKDHHNFTKQELRSIKKRGFILTTEKDFSRLSAFDVIDLDDLYYLPIEFKVDGDIDFKQEILEFIKR